MREGVISYFLGCQQRYEVDVFKPILERTAKKSSACVSSSDQSTSTILGFKHPSAPRFSCPDVKGILSKYVEPAII